MVNQNYFTRRGLGALGTVPTDPAYNAGLQALQRAQALPNYASLAQISPSEFFSLYNNLNNTLRAWADGAPPPTTAWGTGWAVQTINWTNALNTWLNNYHPPADTRPAIERDPSAAAFVRGLYVRYFGREPDNAGWNFWTNDLITNTKTRAQLEQVFANDSEAQRYAAGQNAVAAAAAARAAQQAAEAHAAELQTQLTTLQAQVAAGTTTSAAAAAQIASLQQQLATAQAAATAAGNAADTHAANANDLLSQITTFASSHIWLLGGAAAVIALMMFSGDSGTKRRR